MTGTTQIVCVVIWGTFRKNFQILENSPGKGLFLLRLSVSQGNSELRVPQDMAPGLPYPLSYVFLYRNGFSEQ